MRTERVSQKLVQLLYLLSFLPYLFYTLGRVSEAHPTSLTSLKIQALFATRPSLVWEIGLCFSVFLALWLVLVSRIRESLPRFFALGATHLFVLGLLMLVTIRILPETSTSRHQMASFLSIPLAAMTQTSSFLKAFSVSILLLFGWRELDLDPEKMGRRPLFYFVPALLIALPIDKWITTPHWGLWGNVRAELLLLKDRLDPDLWRGDPALPFLRKIHPAAITDLLAFFSRKANPEGVYQMASFLVMVLWPLTFLALGRMAKGGLHFLTILFLFTFSPLPPKLYEGIGTLLMIWILLSFIGAVQKNRDVLFLLSGVLLGVTLFLHPPSAEFAFGIVCIAFLYNSLKQKKGWKECLGKGALLFVPLVFATGAYFVSQRESGTLATVSFLENTDYLWGRAYNLPKTLVGLLGQFSTLFLENFFGFFLFLLTLYGMQRLLETQVLSRLALPLLVVLGFVGAAALILRGGWIFLKPQQFIYNFFLAIPLLASFGFVQFYRQLGRRSRKIQMIFCIATFLILPLQWGGLQAAPNSIIQLDKDFYLICQWIKQHTEKGTAVAVCPLNADTIRSLAERPSVASDEMGGWGRYVQEAGLEWVKTSRDTMEALFSEDPEAVRNFVKKYDVAFFIDDERYREGEHYRYYRLLDLRVGKPWIRRQGREWKKRHREGPYVVYEFLKGS